MGSYSLIRDQNCHRNSSHHRFSVSKCKIINRNALSIFGCFMDEHISHRLWRWRKWLKVEKYNKPSLLATSTLQSAKTNVALSATETTRGGNRAWASPSVSNDITSSFVSHYQGGDCCKFKTVHDNSNSFPWSIIMCPLAGFTWICRVRHDSCCAFPFLPWNRYREVKIKKRKTNEFCYEFWRFFFRGQCLGDVGRVWSGFITCSDRCTGRAFL